MSACSSNESIHRFHTPCSEQTRSPLSSPGSTTMSIRLVQNSSQRADISPSQGRSFITCKPSIGASPKVNINCQDFQDEIPFSESFSEILSLNELAIDTIYHGPLLSALPEMVETGSRYDDMSDASTEWYDKDINEVMFISPMNCPSSMTKLHFSHRPSLASAHSSSLSQTRPNEKRSSPDKTSLHTTASFQTFQTFQPLLPPAGPKNTTGLCTHLPTGIAYACRITQSINGKPSAERIALERIATLFGKEDEPSVGGSSFLQRLRWLVDGEDGPAPGIGAYMIMDHYPNGSLRDYVNHVGTLDAVLTQYYAAEVSLAIDMLHELGITHGGLSPDCVMLDKRGDIVVCDFTRAQVDNIHFDAISPHVNTCECGVAYACGCMPREESRSSYLAPEVLLGWKHDSAADSWGFGMVLYFMLFRQNPFEGAGCDSSLSKLQDHQLRSPLSPDVIKLAHPATRDLIIKCLHRNPSLRPTVQLIMGHTYFSGMDWGKLKKKLLQVPHFKKLGLKIARKARSSAAATPPKQMSLNRLLLDGHQKPRSGLRNLGGSRPTLTLDTDVRKSLGQIPKSAERRQEGGTGTEHTRSGNEEMVLHTPSASTLDIRSTTPEILASYIVAQSQGDTVPDIFGPSLSFARSPDEYALTIEDEEMKSEPEQETGDILHYIDGRLDEVRPRACLFDGEVMDADQGAVAGDAGILDDSDDESMHRLSLPCSPKVRERTPQERFWEMLDQEVVDSESRTTSSHLHIISPPRRRPRKLQKPRSSAVFVQQQQQRFFAFSDLSRGSNIRLRRCKSAGALRPEYSEPIADLPDGIEQVGMGIGYTHPQGYSFTSGSKPLLLGCTTMACCSVFRGIGVRLGGAYSPVEAYERADPTNENRCSPEAEPQPPTTQNASTRQDGDAQHATACTSSEGAAAPAAMLMEGKSTNDSVAGPSVPHKRRRSQAQTRED